MKRKFALLLVVGLFLSLQMQAQINDSFPWFTDHLALSASLNMKSLQGVKLEGKQIQAQNEYKFIQHKEPSGGKQESWFVLVPADFSGKTFNANQLSAGKRKGKISLAPGKKAKVITCCCSKKPPRMSASAISLNCAPGCKPCNSGKAGSRYHILLPMYKHP